MVKNLPANAGNTRDRFDPWVGKIPWSRKWQTTPVFLPGKSHGQRSLVGYRPSGCRWLDTMEQLRTDLLCWVSFHPIQECAFSSIARLRHSRQ